MLSEKTVLFPFKLPLKTYTVVEKGFFYMEYKFVNEYDKVEYIFKPTSMRLIAYDALEIAVAELYKPSGYCITRKINLNNNYFDIDEASKQSIELMPTLVPVLGYPYTLSLEGHDGKMRRYNWIRKNLIGCNFEYVSSENPKDVVAEFNYKIGWTEIGNLNVYKSLSKLETFLAILSLTFVLQRNPTAEIPTSPTHFI